MMWDKINIVQATFTIDDEGNAILGEDRPVKSIVCNVQPAKSQEKIELYGDRIQNIISVVSKTEIEYSPNLLAIVGDTRYRIFNVEVWGHYYTFDAEAIV